MANKSDLMEKKIKTNDHNTPYAQYKNTEE